MNKQTEKDPFPIDECRTELMNGWHAGMAGVEIGYGTRREPERHIRIRLGLNNVSGRQACSLCGSNAFKPQVGLVFLAYEHWDEGLGMVCEACASAYEPGLVTMERACTAAWSAATCEGPEASDDADRAVRLFGQAAAELTDM